MSARRIAARSGVSRENARAIWDNGGTTTNGPGSVGALWFRGLADCEGVD